MDLQNFENINKMFRRNTVLMLIIVIVLAVAFVAGYVSLAQEVSKMKDTVLVLEKDGTANIASSVNADYMRVYEYENHIKTFIQLWYAFDENNYDSNIEQGLELLGDCGKNLYSQYKDMGMRNILTKNDIHYIADIKDIQVDMNTVPVSGTAKVIQTGVRTNGKASRMLDISFTLSDISRSRENVHGCKITSWEVNYSKGSTDNTSWEVNYSKGSTDNSSKHKRRNKNGK